MNIGKLGKLPAKSSTKALLFAEFVKDTVAVPEEYNFWSKRAKFPSQMFGNDVYGDCTRASQAEAAMHMERIETKSTPKIADAEVVRAYFEMTWRRYGDGADGTPMPSNWTEPEGPGDLGAYEADALSDWRRPEYTFKDTKGRPLTIDAFTRVNHLDHNEIKKAIYVTSGHGIKFCMTLPTAWLSTDDWSIPAGQPLIGDWLPRWGHSMYAFAFTKKGLRARTWGDERFITWEGVAAYCDEVHWTADSLNAWRKRLVEKGVKVKQLVEAVNDVSGFKIAA